MHTLILSRDEVIRGSTLIKAILPSLEARNECESYLARHQCFTKSAPGCTSFIFSSDSLSADDESSLRLPYKVLFRSLPLYFFTYILEYAIEADLSRIDCIFQDFKSP